MEKRMKLIEEFESLEAAEAVARLAELWQKKEELRAQIAPIDAEIKKISLLAPMFLKQEGVEQVEVGDVLVSYRRGYQRWSVNAEDLRKASPEMFEKLAKEINVESTVSMSMRKGGDR